MRALYLGRFNPPHLGHVRAIEYILSQTDIEEIIIAIGSGEKAFSMKNPLRGGERLEIVTQIIKHRFDISKFYVIAVPDSNRNTIWPAHLSDLIPSYDVIFSNNPLVKQLFTTLTTKEVQKIPLINRSEFSGKIIRQKIIEETNWQDYIPKEILDLLDRYNLVERIRTINKNDEPKDNTR